MLTPTHFVDYPYSIPNIEETGDLQAFIDIHEEKALRAMLGTTLYNSFKVGLAVTPTPLAKWTDLRDGLDYSISGVEYHFKGLIETLRPYVYSKYLEENQRKVTNSGVLKRNVEKTETDDDANRALLVAAYNEFSNNAGSPSRHENTFYGFLNENWEDYVTNFSDWIFDYPDKTEFKNQFGF